VRVGAERGRGDEVLMREGLREGLASACAPDPRAMVVAGGDDACVVGAEHRCDDRALMSTILVTTNATHSIERTVWEDGNALFSHRPSARAHPRCTYIGPS
jgi:hypothetical protein